MTRRMGVGGLLLTMALVATAWAGVCPLCLKQIPEGQKYCERHQKEILAARATAREEVQRVEAVNAARAEYRARLEELRDFYEERGDALALRRVEKELGRLAQGERFPARWEDTLPELSASQDDPEANRLLAEADELRKGLNPFSRARRFREAAARYQTILMEHPNSTAVDDAAYGLGEIYSSGAVREYRRAVRLYELCYRSNPETPHDALFRAAQVCDGDLADYERAAHFYWLAYRTSKSGLTRKRAKFRLGQLQKKGFGKDYTVEPPQEAQPAEAAAGREE